MHARHHVVIDEDSLSWGKVDKDEIAMHGSHVTEASCCLVAMTSIVNSTVVFPFYGDNCFFEQQQLVHSIFMDEGTIYSVSTKL